MTKFEVISQKPSKNWIFGLKKTYRAKTDNKIKVIL